MSKCEWVKTSYGYRSGCGYQTKNSIRQYVFCPYCGKELLYNKQTYQKQYYKKHKADHAEYYRHYYQEHK